MTLGEPADRGSAAACPVHMSGRRRRVASLAMRNVRRACVKSSYDEKKRKKSRIRFSDFFSAVITGGAVFYALKAANLSANRMRGNPLLPHADIRISDCRQAARTVRRVVSGRRDAARYRRKRFILVAFIRQTASGPWPPLTARVCACDPAREPEWKHAADAPKEVPLGGAPKEVPAGDARSKWISSAASY